MGVLAWLLVGVAVLVASWALLIVLAARLPNGTLKELAGLVGAGAIRRTKVSAGVDTRTYVRYHVVMIGGLIERVGGVLDELATLDLDTIDDSELHDAVVALGPESCRCGVVSADRGVGPPPDLGRQRLEGRRCPSGS